MIDFKKLHEPFPAKDIEWRVQQFGITGDKPWVMVLAYVTNRAIQERLDEVAEPQNWKNEFDKAPEGGIMCGISIKVDKEWITKYDGAENTAVEAVKGGFSGSMKRAAVQWGIGRYLYNLESGFAKVQATKPSNMDGWNKHYHKDTRTNYYWQTPTLPNWALPEEATETTTPSKEKEYNPGRDEQTKELKVLAAMLDIPSETVEARIKTMKTSDEFAEAIKKLQELLIEKDEQNSN